MIELPFLVALPLVALTYWCVDIVSPALPEIQKSLGLSASGTGLVFSLLFLGRLLGNVPAARLVDRIGSALTAAIGGSLLTAGSFLAADAAGGALFGARVVQGVGISMLVNDGLRSVMRAKPGQGAAMTWFSFMATIGGVFGLQSGGYLTEAFSWRAVFALSAALASLITVTALAARGSAGRSTAPAIAATAAAEPAPDASRAALAAALALNFVVFFNYGAFVAIPLYTEHHFAASAKANANLLLIITLMHLLAAFPSGRAVRRWGGPRVYIAASCVSLVAMALVLPAPGLVWLAAPMVLYGAGQATATNAGGDVLLHLGGRGGRAVGLVRLSRDLGLVVGPYVTGALADVWGYGTPFVVLPILTALTIAFAWRRAGFTGRSTPIAAAVS